MTVSGEHMYMLVRNEDERDRDSCGKIHAVTATDYVIHLFSSAGDLSFKPER